MTNDDILYEYRQWLKDLVKFNGVRDGDIALTMNPYLSSETFDILALDLIRSEFYNVIPKDDNRSEDGKELRLMFLQETGLDVRALLGPCSLMEMLIALAIHIDNMLYDPEKGHLVRLYFWEMLRNLGMTKMYDSAIVGKDWQDEYNTIVKIFLERKYKKDGTGGLFPLKNTRKDQRKIELWYQMTTYIAEMYPIIL